MHVQGPSAQPGCPVSSLKPCPFCGGPAKPAIGKYGDGRAWDYIECCKCSAIANPMDWNTRASDAMADKLAGLLREVQADTKVGLTLGEAQNLYSSIDAALAAYDAERNAK